MEEKLFNLFGFDVQSQKWHEGLLCDSPGICISNVYLFPKFYSNCNCEVLR